MRSATALKSFNGVSDSAKKLLALSATALQIFSFLFNLKWCQALPKIFIFKSKARNDTLFHSLLF
jgi:hypothetical protein